jgi:hypothetical protein
MRNVLAPHSKSHGRSASPSSKGSEGSHTEEGFHTHRGSNHGKASGKIDYDSDEDWADDHPQDQHKSYVQGGYRTFSAHNSRGKR